MHGRALRRTVAAGAAVALMGAGTFAVAAGSSTALAAAQASAGPTVQVGLNDPKDPTIAILEFMPEDITVPVDTPVTWSWDGTIEPHSVTFVPDGVEPPNELSLTEYLAPQPAAGPYDGATTVNSGLQPLGPTPAAPFELSFAEPGDFTYYCVIHPRMTGTVTVVDDASDAETPAQVARRAKAKQKAYLAEGRAAKAKLDDAKPKRVVDDDGTTTWTVEMGITTEHTDILAFAPTPAKIAAGDSVEFVNRSRAPHTATFPGEQEPITNPLAPETATPIPGPSPLTLNAVDLFNTGTLPQAAPVAPGMPIAPLSARRFTFVVPEAGKYEYYCIFHVASGMGGVVDAKS